MATGPSLATILSFYISTLEQITVRRFAAPLLINCYKLILRFISDENRNRDEATITRRHKITNGIAIYQTGASPYWFARIWDARNQKYRVRSTKERLKIDAIEEAYRIAEVLGSENKRFPTPDKFAFSLFANDLIQLQQAQVRRGERSKSFVWDDSKLLSREKDGILAVFGHRDVRHIETRDLRDYLYLLDQNREKPLSASSQG